MKVKIDLREEKLPLRVLGAGQYFFIEAGPADAPTLQIILNNRQAQGMPEVFNRVLRLMQAGPSTDREPAGDVKELRSLTPPGTSPPEAPPEGSQTAEIEIPATDMGQVNNGAPLLCKWPNCGKRISEPERAFSVKHFNLPLCRPHQSDQQKRLEAGRAAKGG